MLILITAKICYKIKYYSLLVMNFIEKKNKTIKEIKA